MSGRAPRRLVSTRRAVAAAHHDAYTAAWAAVRSAAEARGAHAWRFRSVADPRVHLEFLEFSAGSDPRDDAACTARLRALDALAAGEGAEWVEE